MFSRIKRQKGVSDQTDQTISPSHEGDVENGSIELQGVPPTVATHSTSNGLSEPVSKPPQPLFKLLSAGFSFFVAGTNDGSIGALIPYMIKNYHIGTSLIAVL